MSGDYDPEIKNRRPFSREREEGRHGKTALIAVISSRDGTDDVRSLHLERISRAKLQDPALRLRPPAIRSAAP
jgi:hypothetical protein